MDLKNAFISFRIGTHTWIGDEPFNELMRMFERYKGVTDEVTFFTSETHPCLPLSVIQDRATLLSRRMDQIRSLGYRSGINLLSTIGHHNENLQNSLTGDYTFLTDINGNICEGTRCPNDEGFRRYIHDVYRALAESGPDYIWIDDDVRLAGHMPIISGCFCENCLKIYEAESGRRHTPESLNTLFNTGTVEEKLCNRKSWINHNSNTISRLFELIENTVHTISPKMPLGFMTGNRFYEGYDFERWANILAGPNNVEVMWRPGGGFYSDECMPELIKKASYIGQQTSVLPDSVVSIQSEIENFPYQRLKKSAHTTALEPAVYIASGCTGTAFNVLPMRNESLNEFEPLVEKLHKTRPFYDLMAQPLGRTKPQGLYAAWSKDSFAAANMKVPKWPTPDTWEIMVANTDELQEIGIPAAYSLKDSQIAALSPSAVLALSESEIKTILSRGVYLDGPALTQLNDMGYGEYTGFSVANYHNADCIEELLPHALNLSQDGQCRDCRQSFLGWNVPAAELVPESSEARPLSRLIDYTGKQTVACGSGVFENKLGGRVYISGYFPWTFLQNCSKTTQLKSILRWLSRDSLPAYINSYHKINLWVREAEKKQLAAALINTSLDSGKDVEVMLRTTKKEISIYNMDCVKTTIQAECSDGPYKKFVLPAVPSWNIQLIIC